MSNDSFWKLMELAWRGSGVPTRLRRKLAHGKATLDEAEEVQAVVDLVTESLRDRLEKLPRRDLLGVPGTHNLILPSTSPRASSALGTVQK